MALLGGALLAGLIGCETVDVEPAPPEPEVRLEEPEPVIDPVVEPPRGSLIVRIHPDSVAEMPDGAIATVTLAGEHATHSSKLPAGERLVRFDEVKTGRYDLIATVSSGGVEIGSFSYFVHVTQTIADVTIQIDYLRAALVVEADVQTLLDRRYVGTAAIAANACQDGPPSGAILSDLHMRTDGKALTLTIANFQQETLRLSGRIAAATTPAVATGTFESSDGTSGDWRLTHLTAPTPAALVALIDFHDRTRSCGSTLEYSGLEEGGTALTGAGSDKPLATVELLGHGQTRTATLRQGESNVRFDGLLVGTYDIFVGVRRGARTIDSRRESVVLTEAGARVETTFETDWLLPPAIRLTAAANAAPLRHAFKGKSVIAHGPPECTGSIPLVDTTTLTVTGQGTDLAMEFDSFYGNVLELDGVVAGAKEGQLCGFRHLPVVGRQDRHLDARPRRAPNAAFSRNAGADPQ